VPDAVRPTSEPAHEHGRTQSKTWARRHKRVFDIAVEHCVCGGQLKIIAAIEDPVVSVRILTHLGLPARALPRALARALQFMRTA